MIVPVEKSIGQNSAYRHQLGRALRKWSALRFFAKYAQKRSSQNHLIHSVPPATLPHFVQPVLELKQPPEGIRAEAATPGAIFPGGAFVCARIQLATSTSSAPVEIKSRNAAGSRPVAAKNRRSIGQL